MQFVAHFFQKHREKAILGLLVLLSLTLLMLPESVTDALLGGNARKVYGL